MKQDYPYIVVPLDESNKILAKQIGLSDTFCKNLKIAEEVQKRQNIYSGVKWKIKETE